MGCEEGEGGVAFTCGMMSMNGGDNPQKMRVRGEPYCETFG